MKNLSFFQFPTWYQIYCLLTYAYCTVFSVTLVLMELRLCTSKLERQLNSINWLTILSRLIDHISYNFPLFLRRYQSHLASLHGF